MVRPGMLRTEHQGVTFCPPQPQGGDRPPKGDDAKGAGSEEPDDPEDDGDDGDDDDDESFQVVFPTRMRYRRVSRKSAP